MFHKVGFAKIAGIIGMSLLTLLIVSSQISCSPEAAEVDEAAVEGEAAEVEGSITEGLNVVAGTVKSAWGNYFNLPEVPGFDICVTGAVEGGDVTALIGKEVKIGGLFNKELPNLLVAQSIEIKEGELSFRSVYASSDPAAPADFFNQKNRAEYVDLKLTNITKSEDWEGKGKGKVYGRLIPGAGDSRMISVLAADGKEVGKVIVDSLTPFSDYYTKKLRLFDKYWFYLEIKDSIARNLRAKNKEMFRADVVFVGLY